MNENNFESLYKSFSTDKLLDIIDNPNDFQPLAVQTAQFELESRQLTQEQLESAKSEQQLRQQSKIDKQQKVRKIEESLKTVGSSIYDSLNSIQNTPPTNDKFIKFISIILFAFFLFNIYIQYSLLEFMLSSDTAKWDFGTILIFLPWIILPTASLLFWFRNRMGWILTTIYFSYSTMGIVSSALKEIFRKPTGSDILDSFVTTTPILVYLAIISLLGGLTWILCQKSIRQVYKIDKIYLFISLGIGIGVGILTDILI